MSNPAKVLKKAVKAVVIVAAVVAVAYIALPALAAGGGAAAATTASTTAAAVGGSAITGAGAMGAGVAATGTTAAGGGLLGTLGAGAKALGSAVAGADPMVKLGMIQAGSQAVAGAMTPEPETAADQLQAQQNVIQNNPVGVRDFSIAGQPQQAQAGLVQQQYTPVVQTAQRPNAGLLGRYNPQTRKWEQTDAG